MQIAILLVLVVIAVILAPWLLGVAAIAVAAYGLWVAVGMVIAAVVFVLVIGVMMFSSRSQPSSSRTEQMIAEVNQKHREKEAAEQAAARENIALEQAKVETIKKARVRVDARDSAAVPIGQNMKFYHDFLRNRFGRVGWYIQLATGEIYYSHSRLERWVWAFLSKVTGVQKRLDERV